MNESYVPLYRKYRPQTLEQLVGQEHIKNALTNAINLNKISHAYLFTGPRGTGKTSTARIFAKSLNCKKGPTINPCGECESCRDITNSVPMDVIEIDAASNRKVEDTQNILEKILYAPVYGKYKIYIIDEVHMLSNTAFNSLLKTLEEPPENVIFILATTEVHKVLDTIKSRCQRFDFRRITTDDIVKHLRYISDTEKINITDDALFTIAKNSAGGMRDSIALLDQLSVLGGKDAISVDDINKLLGRISFDILNTLAESIINSKPQDALEILENIYNSGNEPVQILSNLLDYLKNLLIVKNCRDEIIFGLTQLNEVQINELKSQSAKIETHQIISLTDKCAEYIKEIKLTNNPRLWLEVAIIDLANLTENTLLSDLQRRISMLENGETIQRVSSYKTPPAPVSRVITETAKHAKTEEQKSVSSQITETEGEVSSTPAQVQKEHEFEPMPKSKTVDLSNDISAWWGNLLDNIQSAPTKSLLKQWANPVELSDEKVVISIKNEVWLKQFIEGTKRDILVKAVNDVFGHTNLTVRLPQAEDAQVKAVSVPSKPVVVPKPAPVEEQPDEPEIDDAVEKVAETHFVTKKTFDNMHSDTINNVLELFEGKILE